MDEAEVLFAIESISHKETVTSLTLRVHILNLVCKHHTREDYYYQISSLQCTTSQIISKRIDSETAWLSHRMIMRDIERFKDMNEQKIVEIKQKEAYFHNVVATITTAKYPFLSKLKQIANSAAIAKNAAVLDAPDNSLLRFDANEGTSQDLPVMHMIYTMKEPNADDAFPTDMNSSTSSTESIVQLEDSLRKEFLNCNDMDEKKMELYEDAVLKIRRISSAFRAQNNRKKLSIKSE